MMERQTAHKAWIGTLLKGKVNVENERLVSLDIGTKKISRVNLIANVVDKYSGESKPYVALTLDDSSGNIRVKAFADSINLLSDVNIGETVLIIGMLRSFNDEIYITPEVVRIVEPKWALIRKLELTKEYGKFENAQTSASISDNKLRILELLKQNADGIEIEKLIMQLSDIEVSQINNIVFELIEEGRIYEPMPGKIRAM